MPQKVDPTDDVDEFTIIRQIDKMEVELIDSWLRQIDESHEGAVDRQTLLELRNLCQLRHRLLNCVRDGYLVTHGAA